MFEIPTDGPLTRVRLRLAGMVSSIGRQALGIEQRQLVVCGFPRSGTSLMYNMLSTTLPGFRYEPFENYFMYRMHRLGNYATKAPLDVLHIPWIDKLNINQKTLIILVLVRDIRDVLTSRHPMNPSDYFIGHDHSGWPQAGGFEKWSFDAPGVISIHEAIKAIRPRDDTSIIRYEELVNDPDAVQSALSKKYGLKFGLPFSEYHTKPEMHAYRYEGPYAARDQSLVREGQRSSQDRVHRWRSRAEDRARIREQFTACPALFDVLNDLGYETSQRWFETLASAKELPARDCAS